MASTSFRPTTINPFLSVPRNAYIKQIKECTMCRRGPHTACEMCLRWIALNRTNDATRFGVYVVYPDVLNAGHRESSAATLSLSLTRFMVSSQPNHRLNIATTRGVNGFDTSHHIARQVALTLGTTTYPSTHIDTFCTHLTVMMANIAQHFYDATS